MYVCMYIYMNICLYRFLFAYRCVKVCICKIVHTCISSENIPSVHRKIDNFLLRSAGAPFDVHVTVDGNILSVCVICVIDMLPMPMLEPCADAGVSVSIILNCIVTLLLGRYLYQLIVDC